MTIGHLPGRGLSSRILALAVACLLLGEVLIFVPSVARFRQSYLEQMIATGHLAALAAGSMPENLDAALEAQLLRHVGAEGVTLWTPRAEVMLGEPRPAERVYDLRDRGSLGLIADTFATLLAPQPRVTRVLGPSPRDPAVLVDLAFTDEALRRAMWGYAQRILALSLLLSFIVGLFLFLSLRRLILMPLKAITARLAAFREMPEDAGQDGPPSERRDEIGMVERELAAMRRGLRMSLKQQMRLAALGAAVGQVSHDLKNILSSAVLISDRLESSADPTARALATRLLTTLERAVRLCTDTLRFSREQPHEPEMTSFSLRDLVAELGDAMAIDAPGIAWRAEIGPGLRITADRDQLYRVLLNLGRNSQEAIGEGPGTVTIRARREPGSLDGRPDTIRIEVEDDGPGIPAAVQPKLFATFSASTKPGGSGLGLAICREVMRSHGGDVTLARTGPEGSLFTLVLPDRVAPAAAKKARRRGRPQPA